MPNMITLALTDLVVKAATSGLEYVIPKLADWVIGVDTALSMLAGDKSDSNGDSVTRRVILQDGSELNVSISLSQVPGLKEAFSRANNGDTSTQQRYTTHIHDISDKHRPDFIEVEVKAGGAGGAGGISLLNGFIGVSW